MFAAWKLCTSKIRKNKVYNILIALIILLSTLLLSTALVIINNTGNLYLDIHSELNGSHEILEFKNDIHNPEEVNAWWKSQEGVIASNIMRYRNMAGVLHQDNNIDVELYMVDASAYSPTIDKLLFAKGNEQKMPDEGTIWIPTSLAYKNDLTIGEKLTFNKGSDEFHLQIAGIVVDLPYCAPFATSARIWMNENDYNQYVYNTDGKDFYMMTLRFADYSQSRGYWENFEDYLETPYLESVSNFESLSSFYMVINEITGFIMIFLACVMLIIAISSIGFTISDDILSNYKIFGIIKSLGMTSFNSICVYLLQYTLLAAFSVTTGIVMSYFLSGKIVNSSMSYLKVENSAANLHFGYVACGVFLFLMFLIIACVFIFSNKTREIEPVQAIRYGTSEKNNRRLTSRLNQVGKKIADFEKLPITLAIGLRAMLKKLRSDIFIIIIAALMTSVLAFCFTFINSILSIDQTMAMWGFDSSDITARVESLSDVSYEEFRNDLLEDDRIENFNIYSDINGVIPAHKNSETGVITDSMSVLLSVVDGSYEKIGFTNIEGRDPVSNDEISIGVNLAQKYDKKIGDFIEVYIQGERCSYMVTGIYQAISNMAYSARVCIGSIKNMNPTYEIKDIVFINVNDETLSEEYIDEMYSKYGSNISASTRKELVNQVFSVAVILLVLPMFIIGIIFIVFTLIIIYCNCHISIKKDMNTYGIYKSLGMRSSSIRSSILLGVLVLELIGAVLGTMAGIGLLPNLLNIVLSNYGIVKMPLVVNHLGVFFVVMIGILMAGLGAWFASKIIRKSSPRILTIE